MKIVFTVNTYYPLKDGVQAVTQYHAEGLVKLGYKVVVITGKHGTCKEEEYVNGVRIIRKDVYTKHAIHRGNKEEYRRTVLDECKDSNVMINVCTQNAFTDWVLDILDDINCKKILYMHGMIEFKWNKYNFTSLFRFTSKVWNNLRWRLYYFYMPKYMKKYDCIVNLHEFDDATEYCKKHGMNKYIVLENAVDTIFLNNESNKQASDSQREYFICISNYTQIKNQELVLESFYKLNNNNYKLVFIGSSETEYLEKLKKKKEKYDKKYGIKQVEFLYGIDRHEIPKYLKNAKLFVTGSTWEAFPVVIVESMASGIPFICTDVGCVRFLPGGVVAKNKKEMIYWMDLLSKDENISQEIGRAGKAYVKSRLIKEDKIKDLESKIVDICKIS